jgi:hypothetical protein
MVSLFSGASIRRGQQKSGRWRELSEFAKFLCGGNRVRSWGQLSLAVLGSWRVKE